MAASFLFFGRGENFICTRLKRWSLKLCRLPPSFFLAHAQASNVGPFQRFPRDARGFDQDSALYRVSSRTSLSFGASDEMDKGIREGIFRSTRATAHGVIVTPESPGSCDRLGSKNGWTAI